MPGGPRPSWTAVAAGVAAAVELALVVLAGAGRMAPSTLASDVPFLAIWVGYGVAAAVVLERRPGSPVGGVLAVVGALPTLAVLVDAAPPTGVGVGEALYVALPVLVLVALPSVFPDGGGGSRARRAGLVVAALLALGGVTGTLLGVEQVAGPVLLLSVVAGAVALAGHVRTAARRPEPQRTQHRIFVAGFAVALLVLGLGAAASVIRDDRAGTASWLMLVGLWSIPLGVVLAMVTAGLWDTDLALGRRAVQVGATALAAVVVTLLVTTLTPALAPSVSVPSALVLGVALAVLVLVVAWRAAGRWLYGHHAEDLLEHGAGDSHEDLAGVVAAAVRSPHAQILAVTAGEEAPLPSGGLAVPLSGGRTLVVQPRRAGESFTRRDRQTVARMARTLSHRLDREDLERDLDAARAALSEQRAREQRRLRDALHDEVGPMLVGAEMIARSLHDSAAPGEQGRLTEALHDGLREARRAMRAVLDEGSPRALAGGLLPAVQTLAARFTRPPVTVRDELAAAVDQETAATAYLVVAEALANVAQHAGASRCEVVLRTDGDLVVTVTDDGRGLDGARTPGLGLASMRGRALELGGEVSTGPGAGGGTCVTLRLPLDREPS